MLEQNLHKPKNFSLFDRDYLSADTKLMMYLETLIEDNLSEGRTPMFYAKKMGIGQKKLDNMVKTKHGVSLKYYLRGKRNAEIYRLLQHTELSMKIIAFRVGFSELSCFTRAFKTLEGTSPSEYREAYRIKELTEL